MMGELYLLYHGVKRLLPDLRSLEDELWEHHSGLIDPTMDPEQSFAHIQGYTPMTNLSILALSIVSVAEEVWNEFQVPPLTYPPLLP